MRSILSLILLFVTAAASAQEREPFPSDYTPHPCAVKDGCQSFERGRLLSSGRAMLGFAMDDEWVTKHWDEMLAAFQPICAKAATCFATHNATFQFCNDALMPEFRATCDRFPKKSNDWTQCTMFVETWTLGRDGRSPDLWREAQACAKETTPFVAKNVEPIVWMSPAKLTPDYTGYINIYAIDPDTKLPVQAVVTIEKQNIFAPANPTGRPGSYYPFKWPVKFNRVPNAQGHRDLVAPMVTVEAEGYKPVQFPLPIDVPKVVTEMVPAADALNKPGRHTVLVKAHDAATHQPVELRVMMGDQIVGDTNKPFEIEIKRGRKRAEIWGTSLFERYSDVVIAPAAKK
jgi:hypothetical protein